MPSTQQAIEAFFAHTKTSPDGSVSPKEEWEPLFTAFGEDPETGCTGESCIYCTTQADHHGHLNKVAWWSAQFAAAMFHEGRDRVAARQWGRLAGLWHDLGKFSHEFQSYLAQAGSDSHTGEMQRRVDHSTAGARHAVERFPPSGHFLAYGIAGHHTGLLDGESNQACQRQRLRKDDLPAITRAPAQLLGEDQPPFPSFIARSLQHPRSAGFSASMFTRMLFSCLVDADFLATEAFMNPSQAKNRNKPPPDVLRKLDALVDAKISRFGSPSDDDIVNRKRMDVVNDCVASARREPGLFTLTVPTGGGKTLSSLTFALKHALHHDQHRIIYVAPFTSIIEQNADIIREIAAPLETDSFTPLIEHHSALSPEKGNAPFPARGGKLGCSHRHHYRRSILRIPFLRQNLARPQAPQHRQQRRHSG